MRPDFELATANTKVGLVLEVEDVAFAHGDGPTLVKDLSFGLVRGDRLGVVGPNGTGKSTLLRLLEGSLTPTAGRIRRGGQIRIAHFDQERAGLVESETVRGTLLPQGGEYVTFGGAPLHVIAWMQRFGFEAEAQDRLVRSLSGGERNRLALAAFLLTDANLLLLDEPTNDLDLFTIAVLEEALLDYNGTVITVSHDRYFLDRVATAIVGFGSETDGRTTFAKGGFADYQTLVEQRRADREARARSSAPRATAKAPAPDLAKKLTYAERRELTELPERLEGLESRLRAEQARLEDPGLWQGDPSRAIALRKTISVLEAEVAAAYARWQDLDARA